MPYGFTFSKDTREITGEQDTLRYSALDCWLKSKPAYRERYYGGSNLVTAETVFGHKIHHAIENGETVLEGLPRYSKSEYNIEVEVDGVRIGGCLDSFDPEKFSFLDYKSSHRNKDGKAPWDNVRVAKHMQLVFYSLLVKKKHGKVDPWTKLVWIETEFGKSTKEFDGHILEGQTRELFLTGNFQVFNRRIAEWERAKLRETIVRCSKEINEDFSKWKTENA